MKRQNVKNARPRDGLGSKKGVRRMAGRKTVLVTGGSGFIGGYCIAQALGEGWNVRTTVRNLAREPEVRETLAKVAPNLDALSFHAADLNADGGWAAAVEGCTHVLHVASPLPTTTPKSDDDLIRPARDGALRVLRAARDAGVERVVLTSSTAAITYGLDRSAREPMDETRWTDPAHPDTSAYIRSKTLAERAAWQFMATEGGAMELATINPGAVLGPVLGSNFSASIDIVRKLMNGDFPGSPRMGFPLVDVRDIADLHMRALTSPNAAGQRFAGAGAFLWLGEVARILRDDLGQAARRVPTGGLPSWLVRVLANFDPVVRTVAFELDMERPVSSEKARRLLGWTTRPERDSILDTARSLIREGVVKT
jgi:nucleoside-diphosphate-sugar epimerase